MMKRITGLLLTLLLIMSITVPSLAYTYSQFSDVPDDAWYGPSVNMLAEKGIVNGRGGGIFEPDAYITRAEFCKIMAGGSQTAALDCFSDVTVNDWFYPYVGWAASKGIAKGDGVRFSPDEPITRQDLAVMVYRYAVSSGIAMATDGRAKTFSDAAQIAAYASEPIYFLQKAGIISPDQTAFSPLKEATRAEAAQMFAFLLPQS